MKCEAKMHSVEMVLATRVRYNVDFIFVLVIFCLIFKDSLIDHIFCVFEKLKEEPLKTDKD